MDFVALCRGFMKERTESQFRDVEAPIKVSNESLICSYSKSTTKMACLCMILLMFFTYSC